MKVKIEGEEVTLEPINGLRYKNDNCQESLRKILSLVKKKDQSSRVKVLPGLLEGLNLAKRPADRQQGLDILKLCLEHDGLDTAMKIVRDAARTGVGLKDIETTRIIAWGWHLSASQEWQRLIKSRREAPGTTFRLETVKTYKAFMEEIRRQGHKVMQPGWAVWAVGLEIMCWRAQSCQLHVNQASEKLTEEQKAATKEALSNAIEDVRAFTTGLMRAWTMQEKDRDGIAKADKLSDTEREETAMLWGPVLNALALARSYAGDKLQQQFLEKAQLECLDTIRSLALPKRDLTGSDPALTCLYSILWPLSHDDADKMLGYSPSKEAATRSNPGKVGGAEVVRAKRAAAAVR